MATIAVIPSPCAMLRISRMIWRAVSRSSWPVGSSASSSRGLFARARAIATRCCSPPDSSYGRCPACPARPTRSSSATARRSLDAASSRASRIGRPTFSAADSTGSSPNDWKMNATRSRSIRATPSALMVVISSPSTSTRPLVGRSRPPMMLSRVVFPEPDRPRSATSSPRVIENDTPRSACTSVAPLP